MLLNRGRIYGLIGGGFLLSSTSAHASLWGDVSQYIRTQQQDLHMALSTALQAVQDGGFEAVFSLLLLSFFYGVFHAAGPGHGKAVIGTYILSHNSHIKRSILLSGASALVQGLTAIILVKALSGVVFISQWAIKDAVPVMEQASFLLVALIGVFLVYRAIKQFIGMHQPEKIDLSDHQGSVSHEHSHSHNYDHGHDHGHGHSHGGGETCSSCGHNHAISPKQAAAASGWRETIGIIISVGIRPCTGSVIVLTFAELFDLGWAGILSVFAISIGTAITVSLLALMTVYFRSFAVYLMQGRESMTLRYGPVAASFIGGLIILALGFSLMMDAMNNSHPLF